MKAAIRKKYGPPHTLRVESIQKPVPKNGEVLIKVHATTVNRTDCAVLTGSPFVMRFFVGLFKPTLLSPGVDFAGEIVGLGEGVDAFKVGDQVWGLYDEGLGSQAEYFCYAVSGNIDHLPQGVSHEDAVASLEGPHYAYYFMNKVKINQGQTVLVNGATGGIGSALLQMLKHKGLEVTAVCNTKNMELIKSLGADRIYNWEKEDFTQIDKSKYDFIFDAVGKSSFRKCKPLMKERGVYISSELGNYGANIYYALTTPIFSKKKVIFPMPGKIKESMRFIKELLEAGHYRPVIDRRYNLDQIAEAYAYVIKGQKTGNVVISMDS